MPAGGRVSHRRPISLLRRSAPLFRSLTRGSFQRTVLQLFYPQSVPLSELISSCFGRGPTRGQKLSDIGQSCPQPAFSRLDPLESGSAASIGCPTSSTLRSYY